jgi:predicted  nucleic acid-binding Zn-ribbon protein
MKTFFDYFKAREGDEKPGNHVPDSGVSPCNSRPIPGETPPSQTQSRSPASKGPARNIALSESPATSSGEIAEMQVIILELGDFLKRIPPEFLRPGDHQPTRELRFDIDEVANNIARGKATLPLSEIVKQCPEIFKDSIVGRGNIEIFFPWQKLAKQVDVLRGYRSRAKLGAEMKKRENAPTWYSRSAAESAPAKSIQPSGKPARPVMPLSREERRWTSSQPVVSGNKVPEVGALSDCVQERVSELVAEREKILTELANTRSELKRAREEASKISRMGSSVEDAQNQIEMLQGDLRDAVAAKAELEERVRAAEAEITTAGEFQRKLQLAIVDRENALRELEEVRAEMQNLRESGVAARAESIAHSAEVSKARAVAEGRVKELEQHIVDLSSRFETLTAERENVVGEVPSLRGHQAKLISSLKSERDTAFRLRDELREEMQRSRDEFQKKIEALTAERDALKREKVQFVSQMDQLRLNHRRQIDFLNGDTEKRVAVMNQRIEAAKAGCAQAMADLKKQREQFNIEIEGLRTERIALAKARDEAIAQERETRKELEDEINELKRERKDPGQEL